MNNKPWAYVTSAWSADRSRARRSAKRYCRKLYEAGYTPICPLLSLPEVIDVSNADEYKDYIEDDILRGLGMCLQQAKRAHVRTRALLANLRSNNDCGLNVPLF